MPDIAVMVPYTNLNISYLQINYITVALGYEGGCFLPLQTSVFLIEQCMLRFNSKEYGYRRISDVINEV